MEVDVVHASTLSSWFFRLDLDRVADAHPHEGAGHLVVEGPVPIGGAVGELASHLDGLEIDLDPLRSHACRWGQEDRKAGAPRSPGPPRLQRGRALWRPPPCRLRWLRAGRRATPRWQGLQQQRSQAAAGVPGSSWPSSSSPLWDRLADRSGPSSDEEVVLPRFPALFVAAQIIRRKWSKLAQFLLRILKGLIQIK